MILLAICRVLFVGRERYNRLAWRLATDASNTHTVIFLKDNGVQIML
jgi:hypothetical protein